MKRKDQPPSKQTINLSQYKIGNTSNHDSLSSQAQQNFGSTRNNTHNINQPANSSSYTETLKQYQPRFALDFINSKDEDQIQQRPEDLYSHSKREEEFERILREYDTLHQQKMALEGTTTQRNREQQLQKLIAQLKEQQTRSGERVSQLLRTNQQMSRRIDQLLTSQHRQEKQGQSLKEQLDQLNDRLATREEQYRNLLNKLEQAEQQSQILRKKCFQAENQLKLIKEKENRDSSNIINGTTSSFNRSVNMIPSTHLGLSKLNHSQAPLDDNKSAIREVYSDVEKYVRHRVQQLTDELKSHRMTVRLEQTIQGFLQEIMHINYLTVSNFKRKHMATLNTDADIQTVSRRSEAQQKLESRFQQFNIVDVERLRLEKSIQKLKSIEQQTYRFNENNRDRSATRTRFAGNGNLSMLAAASAPVPDRSRSKSRKKIFS